MSRLFPSVSFVIVTFNEEKRLPGCLDSIAALDYPKEKIQILVVDGGSTDRTQDIARSYDAEVVFNEKKLAEPGIAKGYELAAHDYVVCMAADNVLYDALWLQKMVQPFIDFPQDVYLSFCKIVNDPTDTSWSKYINEDVDPFNTFVFGAASHPDKFSGHFLVDIRKEDYVIYDYPTVDYPLIALAQGTIIKKGFERSEDSSFDDILPIIHIIQMGKKIAYVYTTGIRHYSLKTMGEYSRKFKKRIYNSMTTGSYTTRDTYTSNARKLRKYLFIPYALSFILPLIEGVGLAISKKKMYMLLHPIASFILAYYIVYNFTITRLKGYTPTT